MTEDTREKLKTIHTALLMSNDTNRFGRYLESKQVFSTDRGIHNFFKQTVYKVSKRKSMKTEVKALKIIKLFREFRYERGR